MIVAPASSGLAAICSATWKPSSSGMLTSSRTSVNGRPARAAADKRVERLATAADGRRPGVPACQLGMQDAPVDGVVVDDEHRQLGEQRLGSPLRGRATRPCRSRR